MPTHAPPVLRPAQRAQIANDLRLACMRISRRVRYEGAGSLAPHQFSVLARIDEQPRTPGELADLERVSAPSMTRTVASLVAGGWVDRTPDAQDRRQVNLTLTPEGRQLLTDTRRRRDAWMAVRLAGLSDDEVRLLRDASAILARIAAE
ncbi:MAG: MarR family transcriptional regulator [Phycicoccus sp.]|nr:MarR family transcriptional regulator [Phycicoccus sp.]